MATAEIAEAEPIDMMLEMMLEVFTARSPHSRIRTGTAGCSKRIQARHPGREWKPAPGLLAKRAKEGTLRASRTRRPA